MALTALQREFKARVATRMRQAIERDMLRATVRGKYSIDTLTGNIVTPMLATGTVHRDTRLYAVTVPGVGVKQVAESTIKKMLTTDC